MGYLEEVLREQEVSPVVEEAIRARRAEVEEMLRGGWKGCEPRFYYGGSFGKRTMIAARFDLDVVVYFPPETPESPAALYAAVERRLRERGHTTLRHNVSLRLQYTPAWHIDVVPGRALDARYYYAALYASERNTTRQTSLKAHIELVRNGDRETIKLLKLWKWRNGVAAGSFVLELAAARALGGGVGGGAMEERLERVLRFLADGFMEARLVDPANSNNVVTDDLHYAEKAAIAQAAQRACQQTGWERVVW